MHGVDKAHFLENTSAIEGAEGLWCGQCVSLVSPFPLQSVSKSEDFATGKRHCGSFQRKKKKKTGGQSFEEQN